MKIKRFIILVGILVFAITPVLAKRYNLYTPQNYVQPNVVNQYSQNYNSQPQQHTNYNYNYNPNYTEVTEPVNNVTINNDYVNSNNNDVNITNEVNAPKLKADIIELIVDYSGSMSSWISSAKEVVRTFLPQIPASTRIGVRVFGAGSYPTQPPKTWGESFKTVFLTSVNTSGCQNSKQIVPLNNTNRSAIMNALNNTTIGGGTPLVFALRQTFQNDLASVYANRKKIILLTDGGDTCGEDPCRYIRSVLAKRPDIQIDVIMFGDSNILQCLSETTNGKYYNVTNKNQLNNIMGVSFGVLPESAAYEYENHSSGNGMSSGKSSY